MRLSIHDDTLRIELSWWMKLLSVRSAPLEIPLAHIQHASTERARTRWNEWEWRVPGASIPGLVKAGTYRRKGRKEFWCVTRRWPVLRLDLRDERFDSVTVATQDNQHWAARLSGN